MWPFRKKKSQEELEREDREFLEEVSRWLAFMNVRQQITARLAG
jgi:hypothetical protein